jgi:hypothetical protein
MRLVFLLLVLLGAPLQAASRPSFAIEERARYSSRARAALPEVPEPEPADSNADRADLRLELHRLLLEGKTDAPVLMPAAAFVGAGR